ncbi:hypothetical protein CN378_00015 [Bacillus sp. AFS015802]|uniref:hypothetical protein n=1 Tax=Bacillus sp. AFS015802 TaxID=2033486 RepID=UPI000BF4BAC9|nr:hypothetical protein [Bacillus sp. AFS015802]PFA70692.1 hypothetical protein CN378_00015 [Bacillus sp. AFS015802]
MTFIIVQDLLDFYLSPLHVSIVFLFILALIWDRCPSPFHLYTQYYDKRLEGNNLILKQIAENEVMPVRVWFTTCMKFQFYHTDNDEESSSVYV